MSIQKLHSETGCDRGCHRDADSPLGRGDRNSNQAQGSLAQAKDTVAGGGRDFWPEQAAGAEAQRVGKCRK